MKKKIQTKAIFSIILISTFLITVMNSPGFAEDPLKANEEKIPALKTEESQKKYKPFAEFYSRLDQAMQEKLKSPVTVIFKHGPLDHILWQISRQLNVEIVPPGVAMRMDVELRNTPADAILKKISDQFKLVWKKDGKYLLPYPTDLVNKQTRNLDAFFTSLPDETRQKLEKPVSLLYKNARANQVMGAIAKQVDVRIFSSGLGQRLDLFYRDVPARLILNNIGMGQKWLWENEANTIFIYPADIDPSLIQEVNEFFNGLNEEVKSKLQKPVILIFSNYDLNEVLAAFTNQTGVTVKVEDLNQKISLVSQMEKGEFVLKYLAKSYGWNLAYKEDVIYISPVTKKSGDAD